MAVFTLGTIGAILGGFISWFSSLPNEFKYIIFLGGLAADSLTNIIGSSVSFIIANTFTIQGFLISSIELLALFTFMPIAFFLLKNSLAN